MKISWSFLATAALLLLGYFLVRSPQEFLHGLGLAFVISACLIQLGVIAKSISAYRQRPRSRI